MKGETAANKPAEKAPMRAAVPGPVTGPAPVSPTPQSIPAPTPAPTRAATAPHAVSDRSTLPARLIELYKLNDSEQRVVVALLAAKAPVSVADLASQLALPLPQLLSALTPEGVLRSCALVELSDSAELGWALPQDAISVSRGLHSLVWGEGASGALSDDRAPLASMLPGLSSLAAPSPDMAWAKDLAPTQSGERATSAIADLVREHLVAAHAVLLSLGGCAPDQVPVLAQQARLRLQRPVLTLDGAALTGWPLPLLVPALRRLRRDSDLRGAVLIVHEARALGGAVRALLRPRPHAQTAPVVLVSDGAPLTVGALPPSPRGEPAWTVVSQSLRGTLPASQPSVATGAIGSGPSPDPREDSEDPAVSASRQEARRQAAIDAARAMGRPVPKELTNQPAPAAAAASPAPAPSAPRPAPAAAPAPTATPSYGPPPGKMAATPAPTPAPAPASDAAPRRAPNPRLAAALAAAGLPPVGSEQYRGGEPPSRRPAPAAEIPAASAPREAAVPAAPPAPIAEPTASASSPAVPEAAPVAVNPAAPLEDDGAPELPLEAEAPVEEVVRVARTTPNQAQRLDLLRKLTGSRHSHVIALFRSFTQSPHPAIREAAEAGMSAIFGLNWNRSRQIAPPVQPPRSEDGGRGPGGAF